MIDVLFVISYLSALFTIIYIIIDIYKNKRLKHDLIPYLFVLIKLPILFVILKILGSKYSHLTHSDISDICFYSCIVFIGSIYLCNRFINNCRKKPDKLSKIQQMYSASEEGGCMPFSSQIRAIIPVILAGLAKRGSSGLTQDFISPACSAITMISL